MANLRKVRTVLDDVRDDIMDVVQRHGLVRNIDLPALVKEESITSGLLMEAMFSLVEEGVLRTISLVTMKPKPSTKTLILASDSKILMKHN